MSKKELLKKELLTTLDEGVKLAISFQKKEEKHFQYEYQSWYTKAIKTIASLAPDRYREFCSYYEIDPKRKILGYGTYVIQDFIKGVSPNKYNYPDFDTREEVIRCFLNQITIFRSLTERIDSALSDIEGQIYADLHDSEISIAKKLIKISPRAAGALVGAIIEGHLQNVASNHAIKISKKYPTIGEINDPLKTAGVIDIPTWRKISFLADIRNLCSHKKGIEPTKDQIEELVQGSEWLIKNIF